MGRPKPGTPTTAVPSQLKATLLNWSFKFQNQRNFDLLLVGIDASKMTNPEKVDRFTTSVICRRIEPRILATYSGSVYKIAGPVDVGELRKINFPTKLIKLFCNGFPENWKELLKDEWHRQTGIERTSLRLQSKVPPPKTLLKQPLTDKNYQSSQVVAERKAPDRVKVPVIERKKVLKKSVADVRVACLKPNLGVRTAAVRKCNRSAANVRSRKFRKSSRPRLSLQTLSAIKRKDIAQAELLKEKNAAYQALPEKAESMEVGQISEKQVHFTTDDTHSSIPTSKKSRNKNTAAGEKPKIHYRRLQSWTTRSEEKLTSKTKPPRNSEPFSGEEKVPPPPKKDDVDFSLIIHGSARKPGESPVSKLRYKRHVEKKKSPMPSRLPRPGFRGTPTLTTQHVVVVPKKRNPNQYKKTVEEGVRLLQRPSSKKNGFNLFLRNNIEEDSDDEPLSVPEWPKDRDDNFAPAALTDTTRAFRYSIASRVTVSKRENYEPSNAGKAANAINFGGMLLREKINKKTTKEIHSASDNQWIQATIPEIPKEIREEQEDDEVYNH